MKKDTVQRIMNNRQRGTPKRVVAQRQLALAPELKRSRVSRTKQPVLNGVTIATPIITTLQKIADARDFLDPRLAFITRTYLHSQLHIHPRVWEYALAYLALENAGVLKSRRRGISFGSGREQLIFAVANRTGHLTVTDLYGGSTAWEVARTGDPREFVLALAPQDFDASKLEVRSMDMRCVKCPNATFDFAYSISAFEHIGFDADFLRHLREVRRVLKPNGVYVLTTELRLGNDTFPVEGNHAFALAHLFTLFGEAGLTPEQTFDGRLSDQAENEPRDLLETRLHDPTNHLSETLIVREFAGVMSVPAVFILRPGPFKEVNVIGLNESVEWLEAKLAERNFVRYSDWVAVNPYGLSQGSHSPYCDLWAKPYSQHDTTLVFATSYRHFYSDTIEFRVTLVTSPGRASRGELSIAIQSWSLTQLNDMIPISPKRVQLNGAGAAAHLCFRVRCDSGRCYSVFGTCISGDIILSDVTVTIRRVDNGQTATNPSHGPDRA